MNKGMCLIFLLYKSNSLAQIWPSIFFHFITFFYILISPFPVNTTIYSCRIVLPSRALINANLSGERLQSTGKSVKSINGASPAPAFSRPWRYNTKYTWMHHGIIITTHSSSCKHTNSDSANCPGRMKADKKLKLLPNLATVFFFTLTRSHSAYCPHNDIKVMSLECHRFFSGRPLSRSILLITSITRTWQEHFCLALTILMENQCSDGVGWEPQVWGTDEVGRSSLQTENVQRERCK